MVRGSGRQRWTTISAQAISCCVCKIEKLEMGYEKETLSIRLNFPTKELTGLVVGRMFA